jgi:hypothetical protein
VMSTGGLAAVVVNRLSEKFGLRNHFRSKILRRKHG